MQSPEVDPQSLCHSKPDGEEPWIVTAQQVSRCRWDTRPDLHDRNSLDAVCLSTKYGCQGKVKSRRMVHILESLFRLPFHWCLSVMWFIHFLSFLRHCSEANYPPVGQSASNQIPRWEQWWRLTVCLMKHLSSVSAGPTPSKVNISDKLHLHEFFC